MGARTMMKRLGGTFAFALGILAGAAGAQEQDRPSPEVVAIVNEANPTPTLSVHQLRLLYALYKRSWSSGDRVELVLPAPGSTALRFLVVEVFREDPNWQIDTFYIQAVFSQSIPARPPQLSARDAIETVRSKPGAIALVERAQVRNSAGLRVLPILDE